MQIINFEDQFDRKILILNYLSIFNCQLNQTLVIYIKFKKKKKFLLIYTINSKKKKNYKSFIPTNNEELSELTPTTETFLIKVLLNSIFLVSKL